MALRDSMPHDGTVARQVSPRGAVCAISGSAMMAVRFSCLPLLRPVRRTLGGCALVLVLASCAPPPEPLRLGASAWAGFTPAFIAEATDASAHPALKAFSFPNAVEVMRAYRNRVIDVAALTADEALLLAQSDPEQRIFLVCDYSNGANAILAKPEFSSIAQLRGRRIGVEPNAAGAFLLARALELAGLTAADVTIVPNRQEDVEFEMMKDRVEAVVVYEPTASRLAAAGARRLFDSRQIPGEIIDVLVTRQPFIDAHPEALQALVSRWFAALRQLRERPREFAGTITNRAHLPADTFPAAFGTVAFVDRGENQRLFAGQPGELRARLKKLHAAMLAQKLLTSPVNIESLIEARFVQAAESPGERQRP